MSASVVHSNIRLEDSLCCEGEGSAIYSVGTSGHPPFEDRDSPGPEYPGGWSIQTSILSHRDFEDVERGLVSIEAWYNMLADEAGLPED